MNYASKATTEEEWLKIARIIVRYQKFRGNYIADRILNDFKPATKLNYVNAAISYIRNGDNSHYQKLSKKFFSAIDYVIKKEKPEVLEPNRRNKRYERVYSKSNIPEVRSLYSKTKAQYCANVNTRLKPITTPDTDKEVKPAVNPAVTNPIGEEMIGVYMNNKIRVMGSKHDCSMFCDGVTAAGGNARIVKITITELSSAEN